MKRQQAELGRPEVDGVHVAADPMGGEVHGDIGEVSCLVEGRAGAAQHAREPGPQLDSARKGLTT